MNLGQAFASAWKDMKKVAGAIASTVAANQTSINAAVGMASGVAVAMGASSATVSAADQFEEVVVGKVAAAAQDAANHQSMAVMFGEAWPTILATAQALGDHPTVQSVTAALKK